MDFYRHQPFTYSDLTSRATTRFRRAVAAARSGVAGFLIILSVLLTQSGAALAQTFVTVEPDTPDVANCFPFGMSPLGNGFTSPWGPYGGFIYQNVPAFYLPKGGILAFDLGVPNDVDIGLDIHMARAKNNGSSATGGSFTKIVSKKNAPSNPRGDSVIGNYELEFVAEKSFNFPGGGLIIRFSNPTSKYEKDLTCTQVLVHGDPGDTSGLFVERFFRDKNGKSPWDVVFPDTVGAFRVTNSPKPMVPACDTTLTKNTKLKTDMDCPGTALYLTGKKSKKVTLDCDDHSISTVTGAAIIASNVESVTIKNCNLLTSADRSHGILLTGGTTKSSVKDNTITTLGAGSYPVSIESSTNNRINNNTLMSPNGYLLQQNLSLQGGGLGIDSNGIIYAVDNDRGSRSGMGKATAFFMVSPVTGLADPVIPLLIGAKDVGIGFAALDILPNGRILVLSDSGTASSLYEIDPATGQVTSLALNLPVPALDGQPNGLEATSDTSLLATTDAGELLNIDLTTGDVTELGEQGTGWSDVARHPTNGMVYALSRSVDETSNTAHLYQIDPANGQIIPPEIGDTGEPGLSNIDFDLFGTLYGNSDGALITIDPADASVTPVNTGGFGPDPLESLPSKNKLKGNLFKTVDGSLQFPGTITLPSAPETHISSQVVEISPNQVMVDSAVLPSLDERARITLENVPGTYHNLLVDEEDDGTFIPCPSPRCKFVSSSSGPLVFDVTGFTSYSSEENTDPTLEFVTAVMLAEVNALQNGAGVSKKARKKLKAASKDLAKALKFLKKGDIKKALAEISKAVKDLMQALAKGAPVSGLIDGLGASAQTEAQAAIDAAIAGNGDVILIAEAEAHMAKAQADLNAGKPDKAITSYQKAWDKAQKAIKAGGGMAGNLGTLSITGPDTGVLGVSYTPESVSTDGPPVSSFSWGYIAGGDSATLGIAGVSGNALTSGTVIFTYTRTSPPEGYGYIIPCLVTPTECAKITIDQTARTMFFDNVELTNSPGNSASAPIVINGTLTWQ